MARRGEQVGFDSVWLGDHLLYRDETHGARGPWEAWTMLAGIAASTSRIAIGPLVACTSFHNPAMLAKMATTVDEISGGRLILGLGAGWNETEYLAFGFPFDRRVARFAEAFTIIRTLLREGHIDFEGEFYSARDCELVPRPRPGGPPLMVGSMGERMLALTVPHVDAWNAWYDWTGNRPEGVVPLREKVDAAATAAGRDPDDTSPLLTRRAWIGLSWGVFSAASAAALAATGRFMFPNVLNEPPQQFKAGFPNEYGMGVDERWKEKFGIWIVRTPEDYAQHASGFYAIISVCTHLGCTPNFLSAENKFKCPCHGSGYYKNGVNFEGPAPRPMDRVRITLADDGQIVVDVSVKYIFGTWDKPGAYLKV